MKRIFSGFLCCIILLSCFAMPVSAVSDQTLGQKRAVLAALYEADISEIKAALDAELLTSVELTQYYLERIEAYNDSYNCFITMCDDALEIASQRDDRRAAGNADGALFGIPVVIKDNMDLTGYHTTNGFKKKDSQIAYENAAVVDYLLEQGAVIIAKANMSTEAQDARRSSSQAVGETKNAYSKYMAAGGSSGGSAVATSLNFAAAALGTDTNSSLRIPAALAGCVSLRPTYGLISVSGIKKLNGTRDVPGAITRSVYDQAVMLDVLTQGNYSYVQNLNADRIKGVRIGVLKQLSYATTKTGTRSEQNIDDEIAAAFENALEELRQAGAEIVEISMSNLFSLSDKTFTNNAQDPKDALYQAFEKLLTDENVEAVVYPTYLSTPIRSGYDANGTYWDAYSQLYLNNCRTLSPSAGLPEISVPIGMHSLGAGIGMEIATLKNGEQLLLDIAYGYTNEFDHRIAPDGAPNDYEQDYIADLSSLAVCLDTVGGFKNLLDGFNVEALGGSGCYYVPQTSGEDAQLRNGAPYWILGCGLLASILTFSILQSNERKRRKRRRRQRKQPTQ